VKHVIVLSDGKLYDGQGPFSDTRSTDFGALANRALRVDGITTSTIAIGEAADFERLRSLALAGGGRYYQALDVTTLPQIFTNEALTATRSLVVDDPTTPTPRPNPLLRFPQALPAVDAYVATTLRADAQELLEGQRQEPILATRRAGLGRTAALTTDLNSWSGAFGSWQGLPGALATLARWLQSQPLAYQAQARRDGGDLRVVVDAVQNGEYVNNKELTVRYGGASAPMEQIAPGRYQARLPFPPGADGSVVVSNAGEVVARTRLGGPDPEFGDPEQATLLAELSRRTGGRTLAPGARYAPLPSGGRRSLWPVAAGLAFLLFLAELVWRRLRGEREAPARAPAA
jgi:hypothetical protein